MDLGVLGTMSDHLVLYVDHLIRPVAPVQPVSEPVDSPVPCSPREDVVESAAAAGPSCSTAATPDDQAGEQDASNEEEPLIQGAECRICQEEDSLNNLESPCACSGSLKVLMTPLVPFLLFVKFECEHTNGHESEFRLNLWSALSRISVLIS